MIIVSTIIIVGTPDSEPSKFRKHPKSELCSYVRISEVTLYCFPHVCGRKDRLSSVLSGEFMYF